jgi:hypothetical protein
VGVYIAGRGDLMAFVHGMANFAHNRGTTAEQENLVRRDISLRDGFLGAFDDSGNYAFIGMFDASSVQRAVLAALSVRYRVKGVVVVGRSSCAGALEEVERAAIDRYGSCFDRSSYAVHDAAGCWRLGSVFVEAIWSAVKGVRARFLELETPRVRVLTARAGIIGVLKYDQGKRIPWGYPADVIARFLTDAAGDKVPMPLCTGRSARTIRGALRLFERTESPTAHA